MQIEVPKRFRCFCRVLAVLFLAAILAGGAVTVKAANEPIVSGPITSGSKPNAFMASLEDLKTRGYMEQEFFLEGSVEGKLKPDDPVSSQPYKIRILVRRPIDSKRFNGAVLVEWLNSANGYDSAPSWPIFRDALTRAGYAWVGCICAACRRKFSAEVGSAEIRIAGASGNTSSAARRCWLCSRERRGARDL